MLFHIYLFVLFAGIGIGSVEYIRWCERSLPASADIPPEIALTFDDGPHPVYTKKLLDGLRKRGVKATFFLIGENIEGNEELVKQMAEAEGVNEELKSTDQMVWVQRMNNIRNRVSEIISEELIYR